MSLNNLRIGLLSLAACGCISGLTLTVKGQPACFITGGSTIVCQGMTTTWSAPDGMASYFWTGPDGFSSTEREISISTAGEYTVLITDLNGQNSCSSTLTAYPGLDPGSVNTTPRQFCTGGTTAIGGTTSPYGPARGGSGSYTYTWQSDAGCLDAWSDIEGTNTTSYTPPAPPVTTCYRRKVTDNICGSEAFSGIKQFEIFPDPVSQSIDAVPAASSVCAGDPVSATFSGGSGGFPGGTEDIYEYTVNGGTVWNTYEPGANITSTGLEGTAIIRIRTRRISTGVNGCNYGSWVSVSWSVYPVPSTTPIYHR